MTYVYKQENFERALEGISRAGYRYVAFGLPHADGDAPKEDDTESVSRIQKLLESYRLEPTMLLGHRIIKLGQPLERVAWCIRTAKQFGVRLVSSVGLFGYIKFPDQPKPVELFQQEHRQYVDYMKRVAEIAEQEQVIVTLKNHTGSTSTGAVLRQTLEEIESPYIKAAYDPGNVHQYEGVAPDTDFPLVADMNCALFAKDHRGPRANKDWPIPGEGDVPFLSIFQTMRKLDVSGDIFVERVDGTESESRIAADELDRRVRVARQNLTRLLEQAGFKEIE
jgi:sugar phosphate isomerase/epimerase